MLFAALTAVAAQVDVPMVPVPMTLQSLAVVLAGGVLGARAGVAAMILYLAAAALGLPVLSGAGGGIEALTGATAGYLAGFILAAAFTGVAARRGWIEGPVRGIAALGAAHLLILGPGVIWLARSLGWTDALAGGFTPFLIGAVAKSAVAWLILAVLQRSSR